VKHPPVYLRIHQADFCFKVNPVAAPQRCRKRTRGRGDNVLEFLSQGAGQVLPHVVVEAVQLGDGAGGEVAAAYATVVNPVA
jgi:hypothetical protein